MRLKSTLQGKDHVTRLKSFHGWKVMIHKVGSPVVGLLLGSRDSPRVPGIYLVF